MWTLNVCAFSILVIFRLEITILAMVEGERKENWISPEKCSIPRFLKAGVWEKWKELFHIPLTARREEMNASRKKMARALHILSPLLPTAAAPSEPQVSLRQEVDVLRMLMMSVYKLLSSLLSQEVA